MAINTQYGAGIFVLYNNAQRTTIVTTLSQFIGF
jgi:hypothetical protein